MAEYHRKIELQSPDDLQYLISNVRRAAEDKIDKDLPPIEGEDKMRNRVEELVHDYISTVFHNTSANITINGLAPSTEHINSMLSNSTYGNTSIEEHEPFNQKLWEKAKEQARLEEDLIEEIAALRRKMPGVAVENLRGGYREGLAVDDETLRRKLDGLVERDTGKGWEGSGRLGSGALERQEVMEGNWRKGVEGLERLKRTMPEMVARGEKAQRAENYVLAPERI